MENLEECSEEDAIEHSYTARFMPDKKSPAITVANIALQVLTELR